ncbi:MAG: hypothetical protein SH850_14325 [Planctomycetaceae bacterium]|nr:hypothetical protein [Planctomycetaceae bacterium]
MNLIPWVLVVPSALAAEPLSTPAENARWRQVFDGVAADCKLVRDDTEGERLALVDRAAYTWARSGPHGGTYGAVYVWTDRGNAESVACFWRYPSAEGKLAVVHELHSLSPVPLQSEGVGLDSWKPQAGLKRQPLKDAPIPASTAAGRMQQMRTVCRDFSDHSVGAGDDRTELRLLPQPLYRDQSTNPDVVDGALFAFVCSVGADPEVFLKLEALNTADGPRWHYIAGRFSHMNLFVNYQDQEVWRALRDSENPISHNADHTYRVFHQPFDQTRLPPSRVE